MFQEIGSFNGLLSIGADNVILKRKIIVNPEFIKESSEIFGSQCITIAIAIELVQQLEKYYIAEH